MIEILANAAFDRDLWLVETASEGMSDQLADELGWGTLEFLWKSGDARSWAWFMNRYKMGYHRRVDREYKWTSLPDRLSKPKDIRRSEISKLTFRLLKDGHKANHILARAALQNEAYSDPLPKDEVDKLVVWCARKFREDIANGVSS